MKIAQKHALLPKFKNHGFKTNSRFDQDCQ